MPAEFKPADIHAGHIRERMAGTQMPVDPLDIVMPAESRSWPESLRHELSEDLVPAGVLIPIIERPGRLSVLLTRRSEELKSHAGQVSFPGGRMESGDQNITETALRETHEEVGIRPDQVDIAGYLPPMPTVTGYAVTPIVGLVTPAISLTLDEREVELAFEVPLSFLLDRQNERWSERDLRGMIIKIVEFHYAEQRIWGATANIVVQLRKFLL